MDSSTTDSLKKNIKLALQDWDFEKTYNLYQQKLTQDLKMDFCLFLKDTGNIEKLWHFLENNHEKNNHEVNMPPPPPHYHAQTFGILKY